MMTTASPARVVGADLIEAIKGLAKADGRVEVLWLYGSRAKGSAQPESDFDLAVAFNTFPPDPWDRRLQSEQLALDWADALGLESKQLSVADINLVPLALAFSIIGTGRVLLAANTLRLAREENRVTSMWEIDHQHHRRCYG